MNSGPVFLVLMAVFLLITAVLTIYLAFFALPELLLLLDDLTR